MRATCVWQATQDRFRRPSARWVKATAVFGRRDEKNSPDRDRYQIPAQLGTNERRRRSKTVSKARRREERIRRTRGDQHDGNSKRKQRHVKSGKHDGQLHSIYGGVSNGQPDRHELTCRSAFCPKADALRLRNDRRHSLTWKIDRTFLRSKPWSTIICAHHPVPVFSG